MRAVLSHTLVNRIIKRKIGIDATAVINAKQEQNLKPWKEIPGPSSLPLFGPIFNFLPGGKFAKCRGIELCNRFYELYGPIVRLDGSFGGQGMVFLFDPEAVERVCRSEEPMPMRPALQSLEYYRKRHNKTYDPDKITGLGTDNGKFWRDFRTKVNPVMMQPKTIQLYSDVMEEVANDMIKRLRSIREQDDKITKKLDVEMHLWALESIAVVALGTRLNCFDPDLPADSPAKRLIQNVHDIFTVTNELDFRPSAWKMFATPMFKRAMKVYEDNEKLTRYFIDKAMKTSKEVKATLHSERPILDKLLEIDHQVALIMASEMLMGGVDTASNTALATLYLLARNPEKQQKLREEILAKQKRKPYLRACIKESMRIQPVATGNMRLSTKEYNLLGYRVPENVLIIMSHQAMSVMPQYYPKPKEYIPERWLVDKEDPLYHGNAPPLTMATFGFGVRMCIGRRIAELEIESLISKVIENFQIEWTSDEPLRIAATALNTITEPFHFVFKDL